MKILKVKEYRVKSQTREARILGTSRQENLTHLTIVAWRDVVYLGWPIAPSYMSPNAGEGGIAGPRPMRTAVHRNPIKIWRSNSIFNLWWPRSIMSFTYLRSWILMYAALSCCAGPPFCPNSCITVAVEVCLDLYGSHVITNITVLSSSISSCISLFLNSLRPHLVL